jgi:hypothetical protein
MGIRIGQLLPSRTIVHRIESHIQSQYREKYCIAAGDSNQG